MVFVKPFTIVRVARNSKHQRVNEEPERLVYHDILQISGDEAILQGRTYAEPTSSAPAVKDAPHRISAKLPVYDARPLPATTRFRRCSKGLRRFLSPTLECSRWCLRPPDSTESLPTAPNCARRRSASEWLWTRIYPMCCSWYCSRVCGWRLQGLHWGLVVSVWMTRLLRGVLYVVSASDPLTAACVTELLALIAGLACYLGGAACDAHRSGDRDSREIESAGAPLKRPRAPLDYMVPRLAGGTIPFMRRYSTICP